MLLKNLSRYRGSSANKRLLIAQIMLKIVFMKYLPPGKHKLVPKLKMLRVYSNLAHLIFQIYERRF